MTSLNDSGIRTAPYDVSDDGSVIVGGLQILKLLYGTMERLLALAIYQTVLKAMLML